MRLPQFLFAIMIGVINSWMPLTATADSPGQLQILWIDTEGGAATLIVTPAGESVLIDTGNPGVRDAERIVKAATREAGVKRIDHLITTHYHRDHFGGAAILSTLLPIGHVHDNGDFEGMPEPHRPECCRAQRWPAPDRA